MPVRSLHLAVHRWPDEKSVLRALQRWAARVRQTVPEVTHIGYIGSYARGDWGHGSDLDVIVICQSQDVRAVLSTMTSSIPVPVDLLCYTEEQFRNLLDGKTRFGKVLRTECRWV